MIDWAAAVPRAQPITRWERYQIVEYWVASVWEGHKSKFVTGKNGDILRYETSKCALFAAQRFIASAGLEKKPGDYVHRSGIRCEFSMIYNNVGGLPFKGVVDIAESDEESSVEIEEAVAG